MRKRVDLNQKRDENGEELGGAYHSVGKLSDREQTERGSKT